MNQAQRRVTKSLNASFIDRSLAMVCARSPVVERTLNGYGEFSLADYLRQTLLISESPLQSRNDLYEVIYRYAAPLLGDNVAVKTAQELAAFPAVLTANHHGVDFLAQSVQGSLIFSLRKVNAKSAKTVPVFACGNISLNNPTYPRGLLLYIADRHAIEIKLPIRLPVFLDRHKRKSVSVVGPFDSDMLAKTQRQLSMLVRNEQITPALAETVATILREDYQDSAVMKLESYSRQAVVLNNRIWKRCFSEPEQAPELIYLELEKIASMLLNVDLNNEDSLIWQVMFNSSLRAKVLAHLDGVRACWNRGKLVKRVSQILDNNYVSLSGSGTIFFWAVDAAGWRIPLLLTEGSDHRVALQGRDEQGQLWSIPFTPKDILDGLQAGRLLPSLFTCYSTIGFARGISCCGGYFQAEYLAGMQRGLINALHESVGCAEYAEYLSQVPSDIYLSGMQAIMRIQDKDLLLPAGPIEIIASGGLSRGQFEQMSSLTVRDAHLAGLIETLPDFQSREERPDNCFHLLAAENHQLLRGRALIIS